MPNKDNKDNLNSTFRAVNIDLEEIRANLQNFISNEIYSGNNSSEIPQARYAKDAVSSQHNETHLEPNDELKKSEPVVLAIYVSEKTAINLLHHSINENESLSSITRKALVERTNGECLSEFYNCTSMSSEDFQNRTSLITEVESDPTSQDELIYDKDKGKYLLEVAIHPLIFTQLSSETPEKDVELALELKFSDNLTAEANIGKLTF